MIKDKFKFIIFIIIFLFSLLGLYASFTLSIETLVLAENANLPLACDLNSVFNCGGVMRTGEAKVFGFPNPFLGLVGYAAMATMAFLMIFNDSFPKYIKKLFLLFGFGAFLFSYWLILTSVYKIGILCPYCILSCLSATNIFFALIIYNLKENTFSVNENTNSIIQSILTKGWYIPIVVLWYFVIISLIILRFSSQ
jgi:uncharacterized membrane protein